MSETPAVPAASSSRWEDIIDVFISPAELFRRRGDGKFGHALIVLVVLTAVLYFGTRTAMEPIWDAEFQRGMAGNPNITPEQMESAKALTTTLAPLFVLIGLPIAVLVVGAIVCLAALVVGGRLKYSQGATIATFAYFPRIVEGVSSAVQALLMDEGQLTSRFSVSLGVGRFLEPQSSSIALALLGRVDLFTLWVTVLIGVGLKQMTNTTTGKAVAGAVLVWFIGALPALLQAFLAG